MTYWYRIPRWVAAQMNLGFNCWYYPERCKQWIDKNWNSTCLWIKSEQTRNFSRLIQLSLFLWIHMEPLIISTFVKTYYGFWVIYLLFSSTDEIIIIHFSFLDPRRFDYSPPIGYKGFSHSELLRQMFKFKLSLFVWTARAQWGRWLLWRSWRSGWICPPRTFGTWIVIIVIIVRLKSAHIHLTYRVLLSTLDPHIFLWSRKPVRLLQL